MKRFGIWDWGLGIGMLGAALPVAADVTAPPPRMYNFGNDAYRQQQFDGAAKAYQQALATDDRELQQRAFYNLGNAIYRLGDPLEAQQPERAMELFKQSLACYNSTLALNPKDADAAFNKQILEARLQKLQQQQQQQNQQDQKQQKQQQNQQQQKQDKGQQQSQTSQDQQKQQQQKQQQQQSKPQQDGKQGQGGEETQPREMSETEAKLLLDALREEEKNWKQLMPLRSLQQREPEKTW